MDDLEDIDQIDRTLSDLAEDRAGWVELIERLEEYHASIEDIEAARRHAAEHAAAIVALYQHRALIVALRADGGEVV